MFLRWPRLRCVWLWMIRAAGVVRRGSRRFCRLMLRRRGRIDRMRCGSSLLGVRRGGCACERWCRSCLI